MTTSTRDRLADAALRILEAEGASSVSIRRVAAEAGVTAMTTYRHFPDRAALLEIVTEDAFASVAKEWQERASDLGFAERFAALQEAFLDFALGRPHLYRYLILEPRAGSRQYPADYRPAGSPLFGPVVEAVDQGIRERVLAEGDPLEIALSMVSGAMGLVALYLGGRVAMPEPEFRALVGRTVERVLDGVRA